MRSRAKRRMKRNGVVISSAVCLLLFLHTLASGEIHGEETVSFGVIGMVGGAGLWIRHRVRERDAEDASSEPPQS